MDEWFGLSPTGRQLREPTGQLVELVDPDGLVYLGIQFDPAWAGHPALVRPVSLVRSFLEYPMVVGLVELAYGDAAAGRFVYPTGPVVTVKELLRAHSDLGLPPGPRAALELLYLSGQILEEAAATGAMQGCFSHGGLTPWRLAVRDDAHVQVFGYGIPQVDVLAWRERPDLLPDADSVRYAPPERLSGHPEDEAADTAALVAIGYELVTGQPLYAGHDPAEVARAASISEAVPMLSRPNALPRDLAQVFARALVFDPDSRLRGREWLDAIAELLDAHRDGDGLEAAVARVRGASIEGVRRARIQQTTETSSFTPDDLAALAGTDDATPTPAPEAGAPAAPRWQKVDRIRRETPAPAPESRVAPPGLVRERRRRREPPPADEPSPSGDLPLLDLDDLPDDAEDDLLLEPMAEAPARPRLRRRLETANVPRPAPSPPPAPAAPAGVPPGDAPATDPLTGGIPRRRRRHEPET